MLVRAVARCTHHRYCEIIFGETFGQTIFFRSMTQLAKMRNEDRPFK